MSNEASRRAVLTTLASTLTIPVLANPARAAPRAGEVATARGECFARAGVAQRALTPDADVFVGDSVWTGIESSLALLLGSATTVRLGAEARLRIDRFIVNAGGVLTLDKGAILYDHDAKNGADDMTVRSPFGLLAVRGTRFFAGPSNGRFGVFVEQGAVMVVGVATAVTITPGLGTDIAAPGQEPTPPTIWKPARIAAAMALFR